jgi:hypothetical protein
MIWECQVQILHKKLPDHENRMLERILTGAPWGWRDQWYGSKRLSLAWGADHPASLLPLIA